MPKFTTYELIDLPLGKSCPQFLIIQNGELVRPDGGSVREYLLSWQEAAGIPDGTPINVCDNERLVDIMRIARESFYKP